MSENVPVPVYLLIGHPDPNQSIRIPILGKVGETAAPAARQQKPEKPIIKPKPQPQPESPKAAAPAVKAGRS